jgi:tritrans,polycis-undecaprenyl-diphosphate synthase [geranylgeranyl-diphosphate specific]
MRAIRSYQLREREHRVKYALKVIKIRRADGLSSRELAENLKNAFKISAEEANSIVKDPLVIEALQGT